MSIYKLPEIIGGAEVEATEQWSGCAGAQPEYLVGGITITMPVGVLLEQVKPPLPPEPDFGALVATGTDGNLLPIWRRWMDTGWDKVRQHDSRSYTWADLCDMSQASASRFPVLLVPAPPPVTLPWTAECATGLGNEIKLDQADDDGHIPVMLRGVGTVYLGADDARAGGNALLTAADEADRRVSDVG